MWIGVLAVVEHGVAFDRGCGCSAANYCSDLGLHLGFISVCISASGWDWWYTSPTPTAAFPRASRNRRGVPDRFLGPALFYLVLYADATTALSAIAVSLLHYRCLGFVTHVLRVFAEHEKQFCP